MKETDDNSYRQEPKTCIEAALSLWIALAGLLALFVAGCLLNGPDASDVGRTLVIFLVVAFELCMVVAFVLGIVGAITIQKNKGRLEGRGFAVAGIALPAVAALGFIVLLPRMKSPAWHLMCGTNLKTLKAVMLVYADEYDGRYPPPDKWCDLLAEHADVSSDLFVCKGAVARGDKGRCHYAMNPDCEPNSPGDVVLLFETNAGWNQHGGPDILTTQNHKGKGCNILFNDGHVRFVPDEFEKLKWRAEATGKTE